MNSKQHSDGWIFGEAEVTVEFHVIGSLSSEQLGESTSFVKRQSALRSGIGVIGCLEDQKRHSVPYGAT